MSVLDGNGWKYGRDSRTAIWLWPCRGSCGIRVAISAMRPTFVGSSENSRRSSHCRRRLIALHKAHSVTVNSTSRGRQNRWLSLCASLEALTASDVLIVAKVEKGEFMRSSLDLFRRNKDGKYIWLEAGVDLKAAKLRLQELSASAPGEYLLFDRGTAQIVERFRNDDGSS